MDVFFFNFSLPIFVLWSFDTNHGKLWKFPSFKVLNVLGLAIVVALYRMIAIYINTFFLFGSEVFKLWERFIFRRQGGLEAWKRDYFVQIFIFKYFAKEFKYYSLNINAGKNIYFHGEKSMEGWRFFGFIIIFKNKISYRV